MIKVVPILSSIFSFLLATSVYASTGEITIHGSVIEEFYCQTTQVHNQVQLDCTNNDPVLSKADFISYSQLEYINQEKTAAVMHISYH